MYDLAFAARAKRSLKKLRRSGSFDEAQFREVVDKLRNGERLPHLFKEHRLHAGLANYRECHLKFDLLLVYEIDHTLHTLTISKIGTHDELFG